MTRRERVVLLGFDALDPATVRALAAAGRMPAFKALLESSAQCPVRNPPGLFVGTLWPTFFTARSPARTGFHCWEEIVAGTYRWRLTSADAIDGTPFWETLSSAGSRVAVIDVPHTKAGAPLNGVQISEWGCHDRHFGLRTSPPELRDEVVATAGLHPVLGADAFAVREWAPDDYVHRAGDLRTAAEEAELLSGLLSGAAMKEGLSAGVLAADEWDLFVSVFGESHSVGHQSWHLHDPNHARHDAAARERLGDPVTQVYERLDATLAAHLALVDDKSTLLILLSHGMGVHNDATHLLPEILRRLDAAYADSLPRSRPGRLIGRAWSRLPRRARHALRRSLAALLRRRLRSQPAAEVRDGETEAERRDQLFFLSPNNFVVGGIRLNVEGREPKGRVRPGRGVDEMCRRLEADLLEIVNVATGTPVAARVERCDTHYQRRALDALPDVFVEWNQDHPIETVWSPRIGVIHRPYTHWRTGDHRAGGLLLASGPGIPGGAALPELDLINLAPSIAARLGVTLPDVDGEAVGWLAGVATEEPNGALVGRAVTSASLPRR